AQSSQQELTVGELQKQMEEMRSLMVKMQNRIVQLEAARTIPASSPSANLVSLQSDTPSAQAFQFERDEAKSPEEPMSIHYKGLTLTPGGFLEGSLLVRTRNENADIANNYSAIPLNRIAECETERVSGNRA